ncbi:hypothetical protein EMIHUDRAFT_311896 [Emiliania huxleyi CCMP1516]|uniref:Folate-biopterin transporter chloroplastic n=2 Tax=Emiliania huxleyi TaxID=2903 RepID=A0A0D3ICI9_EMIH1|nr:hypothetical protein EMIHUDRAFT_311896 [Emiliania huxleyi CCMP1516]EOD08974.1 hypothetical protein EMIHUDRAFT_311896 [Emiliania huxleyi CCMP1516]|eukprot:XP_005761403.1 hypothetical protein EMIHUDRAFT_311896 [Emiliania huxleyi CCMP1516]
MQGVAGGPSTYAVMTVYFGALGLAALARTYFLKDQLGLSPGEQAALMGVVSLPWVIKPVYGFLTDGLPVFGYRRKPYLILAGLLGSASWASLATAVAASTVASLGVAMSDVVVDSLVVERARMTSPPPLQREDESASSGALQSLCWTCQSAGGLASAYFSGSLLETMSPQQVFAITAALPLAVALIALQLDEKRVPRLAATSSPLGEFVRLTSSQGALLWQTLRQRQVWLPTLFVFLWHATPSCGDAFFYFLTEDLLIGPEFLGRVGTSLASIFGIWVYRTYLQEETLRWTTVASALLGLSAAAHRRGTRLSQLLLVTHANRALGIPDTVFTFGDDLVLTVLGQLAFMPLLVLAASLCPPGVEGTLFALLMSTFNAGGIVGRELGAGLTALLGVSSSSAAGGATDFSNLFTLVLLCNLASLLPLLALGFLDEAPTGGAGGAAAAAAASDEPGGGAAG